MNRSITVLVTGSGGFIGRKLVSHLVDSEMNASIERTFECYALLRPGKLLDNQAKVIEADLAMPLPEKIMPSDIYAIVLLASPPRNTTSCSSFEEHVRINVDASARLYSWSERHHVRHVIYVSTSSVYAPEYNLNKVLTEESALIGPHANAYCLTKKWAEELSIASRDKFESMMILRLSHVYGPGQPSDSAFRQIEHAVLNADTLPIAVSKGHTISPIFVDDVVDAIVHAIVTPRTGIFNLGGPNVFSEYQLINDVANVLGRPAIIQENTTEIPTSVAISSTLLDHYYPTRLRTTWLEGLKRTWQRPSEPINNSGL